MLEGHLELRAGEGVHPPGDGRGLGRALGELGNAEAREHVLDEALVPLVDHPAEVGEVVVADVLDGHDDVEPVAACPRSWSSIHASASSSSSTFV